MVLPLGYDPSSNPYKGIVLPIETIEARKVVAVSHIGTYKWFCESQAAKGLEDVSRRHKLITTT